MAAGVFMTTTTLVEELVQEAGWVAVFRGEATLEADRPVAGETEASEW